MPKVLKPFMTPSRVFAPGAEIDTVDGAIPIAHWQDQGFVERDPAAAPTPATPPAAPAAAPAPAPGA